MPDPTRAVWVDFNDIADGTIVTHAEIAELDRTVAVGDQLTADDGEGSRCPATVTKTDGPWITLQLDLGQFQPATAERKAGA